MSEQEQPYGEWLETLEFNQASVHYGPYLTRALRELRQRDEELERLRARVAQMEREIDGIYEDAAGASM